MILNHTYVVLAGELQVELDASFDLSFSHDLFTLNLGSEGLNLLFSFSAEPDACRTDEVVLFELEQASVAP